MNTKTTNAIELNPFAPLARATMVYGRWEIWYYRRPQPEEAKAIVANQRGSGGYDGWTILYDTAAVTWTEAERATVEAWRANLPAT